MQEKQARAKIKATLLANRKKSVHVSMFSKTHSDMRKYLLDKGLSIQETFEYLASMMAFNHPSIDRIIENFKNLKKESTISKLEQKFTQNLYDVIGIDNPLCGEKNVINEED